VKSCLETAFKDVRHRQDDNHDLQCFLFNDGPHSSQLVIDRTFLDGIRNEQLVWLENYYDRSQAKGERREESCC